MQTNIENPKKYHLKFDFVPKSCSRKNLHYCLEEEVWSELSYRIRKKTLCCPFCGLRTSYVRDFELHEIWSYNMETGIQKLEDMVSACKKCHDIIHYNLTLEKDDKATQEAAKKHYLDNFQCSQENFEKDYAEALRVSQERNKIVWIQDMSYLLEQNLISADLINRAKFEKHCPGSVKFLDPILNSIFSLRFETYPTKKLINEIYKTIPIEQYEKITDNLLETCNGCCEICKDSGQKELYVQQIFRRVDSSNNIHLLELKAICPTCKKTIEKGGKYRWFQKFRKTTKHYMKVNNCDYKTYKKNVIDCRKAYKTNCNVVERVKVNLPNLPETKIPLTFECYPSSNVRQAVLDHLSKASWNHMQEMTLKKSNGQCEICKKTTDSIYAVSEVTVKKEVLVLGLKTICQDCQAAMKECHSSKHNETSKAVIQYQTINQCDYATFLKRAKKAKEIYDRNKTSNYIKLDKNFLRVRLLVPYYPANLYFDKKKFLEEFGAVPIAKQTWSIPATKKEFFLRYTGGVILEEQTPGNMTF